MNMSRFRHFFYIILTVFLSSCSTIRYVEVPKVKVEYRSLVDTTIIHDSIYVERGHVRDTFFLTKYKYKYIERIHRDTLNRVDTISVIKEVKVPERYIPEYYRKIHMSFWILVVIVTLVTGFRIWKKFRLT